MFLIIFFRRHWTHAEFHLQSCACECARAKHVHVSRRLRSAAAQHEPQEETGWTMSRASRRTPVHWRPSLHVSTTGSECKRGWFRSSEQFSVMFLLVVLYMYVFELWRFRFKLSSIVIPGSGAARAMDFKRWRQADLLESTVGVSRNCKRHSTSQQLL